MLRRPFITSDECRRRAEEAQTLAAQTQDDWERELFQRIITQWVALAIHKEGTMKTTPSSSNVRRRPGGHSLRARSKPIRAATPPPDTPRRLDRRA